RLPGPGGRGPRLRGRDPLRGGHGGVRPGAATPGRRRRMTVTTPFRRASAGYERRKNAGSSAPGFRRSSAGSQRRRNAGSAGGTGAVLAFLAAGAAGVALAARVARGGALPAAGWGLLAELALWAAVWVLGGLAAFRLPGRVAVPLVFLVAVALRVAAIAGPPTT